jgi:peptide deformylase
MIRGIILFPDKLLEQPCDPVKEFDTGDLHQLLADMFETMYFYDGLGLAAPQIGVMKQVAVIDPSSGADADAKLVLINPTVSARNGTQRDNEGCLSFPGFFEQITRSMAITVDTRDASGKAVRLESSGRLARALQHEIDHLNGILFIRRMSSLKRELICRKIRKLIRAGDWSPAREHA